MSGNLLASVFSTTKYSGNVTTGELTLIDTFTGYSTGYVIGSVSPTTIQSYSFIEFYNTNGASTTLQISGFGADPGTGFITSVIFNGVTKAPNSYSYLAGTGTWGFATDFTIPASGTYTMVMN